MIFVTMGTYPLPFDRLIKAIDDLAQQGVFEEEVFAQIGYCRYLPKSIPYKKMMEKELFDETLASASQLIGHAGMGTITLALDHMKPLLVMPRLKKYGEHVNDHQLGTAHKFEDLGHVLAAYNINELSTKIQKLKTFVPKSRKSGAGHVAARIETFLKDYAMHRSHS